MRTIKGRLVCSTTWDGRGRAHILHPLEDRTVCGRGLEPSGAVTGKSCGWCAEGAAEANRLLRATAAVALPPPRTALAWLARHLG